MLVHRNFCRSSTMQGSLRDAALVLMTGLLSGGAFAQAVELRTPQSFDAIADKTERSRALFVEAGKVIQSPRCLNCHPNGDRPTQGNDMHLHQPMVVRGQADMGATALRCMTCHQGANFAPSGVPGHPLWHLAPISMAWQGKSLGQICEQIKDRKRNGDKSLAQIHEHMARDTLVGWGWNPGGNRTPAPGTQAAFGQLVEAWISNGAACPPG
jgi:hypothetical protein